MRYIPSSKKHLLYSPISTIQSICSPLICLHHGTQGQHWVNSFRSLYFNFYLAKINSSGMSILTMLCFDCKFCLSQETLGIYMVKGNNLNRSEIRKYKNNFILIFLLPESNLKVIMHAKLVCIL